MTVRVLIVDDQRPFRDVAKEIIEAADGFEVVGEAETGEQSVALANDLAPDLVLMDVNLPGIDGIEATRRMRASVDPPPIVLLISTYEEAEYAPRAAECGAAAYLPKAAFTPQRLAEAWRDATST